MAPLLICGLSGAQASNYFALNNSSMLASYAQHGAYRQSLSFFSKIKGPQQGRPVIAHHHIATMGKRQRAFLMRSQSGRKLTFTTQVHRWLSASVIATMMAISTVVVAAELPTGPAQANLVKGATVQPLPASPARSIHISQRIRRKDIWQEVQKQLPSLPLENQYINTQTGEASQSNTLVQRMIEYHNFRKGRSPRSRFDWKLTLADYLGIHEIMVTETYPGVGKLKINPISGDRAAIQAMDREQRQQLVDTLVSLYDPRIPTAFFEPAKPGEAVNLEPAPPQPSSPTEIEAPNRPTPPPLAEPGAADLLRPRN